MPAERSRATTKRSNEVHATQLVWAVDHPSPAEVPANSNVSFATNMTPTAFEITSSPSPASYASTLVDDLPPLVDAPVTCEFQLFFPPTEGGDPNLNGSKRAPHSKKKPENHIPRPPNAFILFRSSFIKSQHVSAEVETNHSTLSKIIGMTWQNLPEEQRQAWHAKARTALAEHRKKFPKYTFRPAQNKARCKAPGGGGGGNGQEGTKRRVREVEPKDLKRCAKIAELLVEGKKGAELDAAIQEFDRHHVPEIVTRFEAPITARAYRRSSSAPIPDTENSRKSQTFLPQSPVLRAKDGKRNMPRATSIQPTRYSTPSQDDRVAELINATLKQEPSLDFSSFSFANVNHEAAPMFECDPLSPISPTQAKALLRLNDDCSAPAPLSIPNIPSFLMDDWSLSSSPISPFASCDTFSTPSPISTFDPHGAFDNTAFEALNLSQDCTKSYTISDPLDMSSLSLPPGYDPSAGVGINMLDMDMTGLVSGFEGTQYMDLLAQPPCSQQHYQQHQPSFIPNHHGYQHHMPNLDLDLTALMSSGMAQPTQFVL